MITHFGINTRDHILNFQSELHKRILTGHSKLDHRLSTENLGKNFGAFIYEKNEKRLLVLIDADDGSGGTTADCKIIWSAYNNVLESYKPQDVLVLKSQVNTDPEYNQFYPFKSDVHALGIFSNDPRTIQSTKKKLSQSDKDIDVFFAGGLKFAKLKPHAWPKNRDPKRWWPGASNRGYQVLNDIKSRRKDLNVQIFDQILQPHEFYDYISRSKICIDLPGIGLSSRKFYEYMVLEKCVLALKQQITPWTCQENIHYSSMGYDLDFLSMERKIDELLLDDRWKELEKNVSEIQQELTMDFMIQRAINIIDTKVSSMTSQALFIL
jgi:hypothetical protein